jgi:mitogen-activated protein kinase kinase
VLPSTGLGGGPGRRLNRPSGMTLSSMGGGAGPSGGANGSKNSPFGNFSKIVDPSGKLNFDQKAILHAEGVNFSNGKTFEINKDQMELQEELGKGNYGEVRKVYHKPTKVTMAMKVSPRSGEKSSSGQLG